MFIFKNALKLTIEENSFIPKNVMVIFVKIYTKH